MMIKNKSNNTDIYIYMHFLFFSFLFCVMLLHILTTVRSTWTLDTADLQNQYQFFFPMEAFPSYSDFLDVEHVQDATDI